jgi:antitoxin component of RelBE/YafQ-DinJ toxin-antitoxin module
MAKTRDVKMTLRVTQTLRDEFSACAKIQGVTVSSLFNQFMKKTILETKKAMPEETKFKTRCMLSLLLQLWQKWPSVNFLFPRKKQPGIFRNQ